MSDFSGLDQALALPAMAPQEDVRDAGGRGHAEELTRSYDVKLPEIEFRRLHAADEVHAIQRMRAQIQLPGTALADPGFFAREKKRTEKGWSVHSNGGMRSSGR